MWYVIHSQDNPNSLEKRLNARTDHIERLKSLLNQGRLMVAGPLPAIDNEDPGPNGYEGSLVIAEFDSLEDAKEWAQNDPYVTNGIYHSFTIQPFKKVFP